MCYRPLCQIVLLLHHQAISPFCQIGLLLRVLVAHLNFVRYVVGKDASGLNQIWLQVREGGCGDPNIQIWQLHTTFCLQIQQNFPRRPLAVPLFFPPIGQMVKTAKKKNLGKKSRKRGKSGQISIFEFQCVGVNIEG